MGQKSSSKKRIREIQERRKNFKKNRDKKKFKNALISLIFFALLALFMISTKDFTFWNAQAPIVLIFGFVGAGFLGFAIRSLYQQLSTRKWESTKCTILVKDQEPVGSGTGGTSWHSLVYYTYTVGGVSFTSNKISLGLIGFSSFSKAVKRSRIYKENEIRECWYNPKRPSMSVLERDLSLIKSIYLFLCAVLFFALGLLAKLNL